MSTSSEIKNAHTIVIFHNMAAGSVVNNMDQVLGRYCRTHVGRDLDEYVGPWDVDSGEASGYCVLNECANETCDVVVPTASGYAWRRQTRPMNVDEATQQCASRHNGTTVICDGSASPPRSSDCLSERRACKTFDSANRRYLSTPYDYFLSPDGTCVYRPVNDSSGTPLDDPARQCETSVPALDSRTCDDGSVIEQTYDARGQPEWTTECPECDNTDTVECHTFRRRPHNISRGEWVSDTARMSFGQPGDPNRSLCAHRYPDGSLYDYTACVDMSLPDVHSVEKRPDLDVRGHDCKILEKTNWDRYSPVDIRYYPRYKLLAGDDMPYGIELYSSDAPTVDVTSTLLSDVCFDIDCPDGSQMDLERRICVVCDDSKEYFHHGAKMCAPMRGCTAVNRYFEPHNLPEYFRRTNSMGDAYNTMDNSDDQCTRCPINTYIPTGRTAYTEDAHRLTCMACGNNFDDSNRFYLDNFNRCVECPGDQMLVLDWAGRRGCEPCPACGPECNGYVHGGDHACELRCDEGYFGGGAHTGGRYPPCHAYCGSNQYFDGAGCQPCQEGFVKDSGEHRDSACTPCPMSTYRGEGNPTCNSCPSGGGTDTIASTSIRDCFVDCPESAKKSFYDISNSRYNDLDCD